MIVLDLLLIPVAAAVIIMCYFAVALLLELVVYAGLDLVERLRRWGRPKPPAS